ncbi:MAG: hypothetical protein Q9M89_05460 [Persephonella sp.]|nr:hypothetical protein [Persephonella sp.]
MRKIITAVLLAGVLTAGAKEKDFTVSFGDGGLKKYSVVDNTCFSYIMGYPKTDRTVPNIMNEAVLSSLAKARKNFSRDYDGFINVKVFTQFIDKRMIIYQICGDLIRRK